jgi:hypothetical protein
LVSLKIDVVVDAAAVVDADAVVHALKVYFLVVLTKVEKIED